MKAEGKGEYLGHDGDVVHGEDEFLEALVATDLFGHLGQVVLPPVEAVDLPIAAAYRHTEKRRHFCRGLLLLLPKICKYPNGMGK